MNNTKEKIGNGWRGNETKSDEWEERRTGKVSKRTERTSVKFRKIMQFVWFTKISARVTDGLNNISDDQNM